MVIEATSNDVALHSLVDIGAADQREPENNLLYNSSLAVFATLKRDALSDAIAYHQGFGRGQ